MTIHLSGAYLLPAFLGLALAGSPPAAGAPFKEIDLSGTTQATISGSGTSVIGSDVSFTGGSGPGTSSYDQAEIFGSSVLNLQAGGSFTDAINAHGNSTVNVTGGTGSVAIFGNATATIFGGDLHSVVIDAADASSGVVNVSGGNIYTLVPIVGGVVNVSGGNVTLAGGYSGVFNFTGGMIGQLNTGGSAFNIFGGRFGAIAHTGAYAGDQITDIFGRDLAFKQNVITGILQNGQAIDVPYAGPASDLELNGVPQGPAPEMSTFGSMGLMLLIGGGFILCARRRKQPLA